VPGPVIFFYLKGRTQFFLKKNNRQITRCMLWQMTCRLLAQNGGQKIKPTSFFPKKPVFQSILTTTHPTNTSRTPRNLPINLTNPKNGLSHKIKPEKILYP
jgi:hypothetical protein